MRDVMGVHYSSFCETARAAGWTCERRAFDLDQSELPLSRYPWLPKEYLRFVGEAATCVSCDEKCWLLTADDFSGASDSAFEWNEFEGQSLGAAAGDAVWEAEIRGFWSAHCPVAVSLRSGYRYFAIRRDGCVVTGCDPEFEESTVVAASFAEFLARTEAALRGDGEGFADFP